MINKFPDYADIINLPHYEPRNHKRMSRLNRAAQFAPFDALTGYEESIAETARIVDEKIELDEMQREMLDARLQIVRDHFDKKPLLNITYFIADEKKKGGKYQTIAAHIIKIDDYNRWLVLDEGSTINCDDIYFIDGEIFPEYL